ncbi:pentapeptide repeat-containing protein [Pseudomonas sp. 3HC3]|uniref:pentapeptide repeat-containing protein n=1 Tax=Pseudomonas sp. 3HC3 TaxID=2781025 RepID=UPI00384BA1A6
MARSSIYLASAAAFSAAALSAAAFSAAAFSAASFSAAAFSAAAFSAAAFSAASFSAAAFSAAAFSAAAFSAAALSSLGPAGLVSFGLATRGLPLASTSTARPLPMRVWAYSSSTSSKVAPALTLLESAPSSEPLPTKPHRILIFMLPPETTGPALSRPFFRVVY